MIRSAPCALLAVLLLASCTDKKEPSPQADPLPSAAEVQEIDEAAKQAADAITEENAEDALGALEDEIADDDE